MKKLLIVGYLWPYHQRAAARIPGLAKYLPEFGWEPVLVTAPLNAKPDVPYQIIETGYRGVLDTWLKLFHLNSSASTSVRGQVKQRMGAKSRRSIRGALIDFAFTRLLEVIDYPDLDRGWKPFALDACARLWTGDIKAVFTSSPPVTSHIIARDLKKRYRVPWIADFPHLWSQNNSYHYSSLRRLFDRRLELKTLSPADILTTTSGPLADKLRALHRQKPVCAITHGFDPETTNNPPDKLTDNFTITYTGGFSPVFREPSILFTALQNLLSRGTIERDRLEVRFYGQEEAWIDNEIEKYNLTGVVKQYGKVTMPVAQARQRDSQLLYNPKWNDPQEPGIHSMKILEYLAARRPILATGDYRDVADELLSETGAGVSADSVEEVEQALAAAYQEYCSNGAVSWLGDETAVNRYSQREMAGRFAEILDRLTG